MPKLDPRFPIIAMTVVGLVAGVGEVAGLLPLPGDATQYWWAAVEPPRQIGYPPALAQILGPVASVGYPAFVVVWTALCFASLGYVASWWTFPLCLLGIAGIWFPGPWNAPLASVLLGNVMMPMVAAIVLGMRYPGLWAVPFLTKITVGVGALWFAFRREWRAFAIAMGTTLVLTGILFALGPAAWFQFAQFAMVHAQDTSNGVPIVGPPWWLRLPVAIVLVAFAARTDRPWLVPITCATAILGLYGWGTFFSVAVGGLVRAPWSSLRGLTVRAGTRSPA